MRNGPALILALALSGCSVTRLESTATEGPGAELAFVAVRGNNRPTDGYAIELSRHGRPVALRECLLDDPVLLHDLEPGVYDATIRGTHLTSCDLRLRLRPGRRTTLVVLHQGLRRRERAEEVLTAAAEGPVKLVGIAVLGIVEGCGALCKGAWEAVWDDWGSCDRSHKESRSAPEKENPQPRIKDWLKPKS